MSSKNQLSNFGEQTAGVQMLKQIWAIDEHKTVEIVQGNVSTDIYGTSHHGTTGVPKRRNGKRV